jgi:hypothetical protein
MEIDHREIDSQEASFAPNGDLFICVLFGEHSLYIYDTRHLCYIQRVTMCSYRTIKLP